MSFFKSYQANEEYIDINRLHTSPNLKLKKYKESVYYGDFVNGKRHGEGIMVYSQGGMVLGKDDRLVDLLTVGEGEERRFRIY